MTLAMDDDDPLAQAVGIKATPKAKYWRDQGCVLTPTWIVTLPHR